jgi:hypothetical protein
MRDRNTVMANLNYVGVFKEILVVDFSSLQLDYLDVLGSQQTHKGMLPYIKMSMGFGWSTLHVGYFQWLNHMSFL